MKIYKIWQNKNCIYDTYDSAIVIAYDEEDAKKIHPNIEEPYDYPEDRICKYLKNFYPERPVEVEEKCENSGGWVKKEFVQVEYIGEAKDGSKKGVVLASYNAG